MNVLDLFSGIGGFSLGLELASPSFRTVAFCEREPFCQSILKKHWPDVPIYADVRTLDYDGGPIDLICGGYPCQPFSLAGKRQGDRDDRHLWPAMRGLIEKHRPAWVIGENVAGHVSMGLDDVLSDLESLDYTARPFVIPACAVDAPHRRDRIWIVAHADAGQRDGAHGQISARRDTANRRRPQPSLADADSQREQQQARIQPEGGDRSRDGRAALADANCDQRHGRSGPLQMGRLGCQGEAQDNGDALRAQWIPEPGVGRVAHGIPDRVDRLKALGNAIVPQVAQRIGAAIIAAEMEATP